MAVRTMMLASLALLGSAFAIAPAAAQDATNGRIAWSVADARQDSPRPFWAAQARTYGNCIVKADAQGSLRYVRAAAGSAAANAARSALAPVLSKCESALGAWAPHLREADRRNAVQAALQRTRNKQS